MEIKSISYSSSKASSNFKPLIFWWETDEKNISTLMRWWDIDEGLKYYHSINYIVFSSIHQKLVQTKPARLNHPQISYLLLKTLKITKWTANNSTAYRWKKSSILSDTFQRNKMKKKLGISTPLPANPKPLLKSIKV